MKNTYLLPLLVGALILVGAGCWSQIATNTDDAMIKDDGAVMEENDSMMESDDTMVEDDSDAMMQDDDAMMEDDDAMMEKNPGAYEAYSESKLSRANNGDVVLFFKASWCPSCQTLDANIQSQINEIPEGLSILTVDYDTETALKRKYGVTYQHTFVQVDAEGNEIKQWSGSANLDALVQNVQ